MADFDMDDLDYNQHGGHSLISEDVENEILIDDYGSNFVDDLIWLMDEYPSLTNDSTKDTEGDAFSQQRLADHSRDYPHVKDRNPDPPSQEHNLLEHVASWQNDPDAQNTSLTAFLEPGPAYAFLYHKYSRLVANFSSYSIDLNATDPNSFVLLRELLLQNSTSDPWTVF